MRADGIPPRSLSRSRQGCRRLVVIPTGILDFNLELIASQVAHCEPAAAVHAHAGDDSIETQLVNLGRGTAQKPSCGVYPNKFVVRPLHALSPVVGAPRRLECCPVLRMRNNSQFVSRIPPSSAQPHTRPRDRESSARSGKGERAIPIESRIDNLSKGRRSRWLQRKPLRHFGFGKFRLRENRRF